MPQTTIDDAFGDAAFAAPADPIPQLIADEILYLRREIEEMKRDMFDVSVMLGRLTSAVTVWVGVAEE